jgi:hypothetical protein
LTSETPSLKNGSAYSDIDECAENSDQCAQNCRNIVGSYVCSCNAGYTLNGDGRRCDGKTVGMVKKVKSCRSFFQMSMSVPFVLTNARRTARIPWGPTLAAAIQATG